MVSETRYVFSFFNVFIKSTKNVTFTFCELLHTFSRTLHVPSQDFTFIYYIFAQHSYTTIATVVVDIEPDSEAPITRR